MSEDENFNKDLKEINEGSQEIAKINNVEIEASVDSSTDVSLLNKSDLELVHEQSLKEYYGGKKGLLEKLKEEGKTTYEGLINGLIEEMYKSVDNLKGNEIVAKKKEDLGASTLIESKHMEAMTQLSKVLQQKQIFDKENGIDLNSPQMTVILKYFLDTIKETFESIKTDDEQQSLFWTAFVSKVDTWKKDIQDRIDNMKIDIEGSNQ